MTLMASSERIRVVLMQPYLGKGHKLYTDNYYTSPNLAPSREPNSPLRHYPKE